MTTHIKICGDPQCEAIYHNTPKTETRCKNCNGRLIIINEETFYKKYSQSYFQYDFVTEEYFRPEKKTMQLDLFSKQTSETQTFYKVRFTNIYARMSDDRVEIFSSNKKAHEALNNWKNAANGNTGIITDFIRKPLRLSLEA